MAFPAVTAALRTGDGVLERRERRRIVSLERDQAGRIETL